MQATLFLMMEDIFKLLEDINKVIAYPAQIIILTF